MKFIGGAYGMEFLDDLVKAGIEVASGEKLRTKVKITIMRIIIPFLISLPLLVTGCRGWYRIIPDVDAVDSVVYYRTIEQPRNRIVIKNPESVKELGIIFNCENQREYYVKYLTTKKLEFYCKDTVITLQTSGDNAFRSEFYYDFSILNNIDDLMNRYSKKE